MMSRPRFAFATVAALAGCGSLGFLTDERPNGTQQDAIADAIDQAVTIATTLDDPASASDADLATIMTFDHLVFLVAPELAAGGGAQARVAAPASLDDCYTDDGAGTIELVGCQVSIPGAEVLCVVDGTFRYSDTSFDGGAALSGETCPARTIDFALELSGPLDAPIAVTGELRMTDVDDAGTDLDLRATIDLGIADGCDVPSEGTIDVEVSGTFRGDPVDGARTVVFHADPECGYLSLE